jgi:hypothetical protein
MYLAVLDVVRSHFNLVHFVRVRVHIRIHMYVNTARCIKHWKTWMNEYFRRVRVGVLGSPAEITITAFKCLYVIF